MEYIRIKEDIGLNGLEGYSGVVVEEIMDSESNNKNIKVLKEDFK